LVYLSSDGVGEAPYLLPAGGIVIVTLADNLPSLCDEPVGVFATHPEVRMPNFA
jgi:hypothetical protein